MTTTTILSTMMRLKTKEKITENVELRKNAIAQGSSRKGYEQKHAIPALLFHKDCKQVIAAMLV